MLYKNYLKSVLFSFIISWALFVIAALYQVGAPTASSSWIYELSTIKSNFANSIKTPKLLIVAGSNALFGISSRMITEETGIPTVNAAIHAGLGNNYILYSARFLAKAGDTIILPLEYASYTSSTEASSILVDYVFARDPKYLLTHPWFIALLSFERLKLGISVKLHTSPIESGYQSKTINASGDETANREADITVDKRKKLDNANPIKIKKKFMNSSAQLKTIREFSNWCHSKGIRLIATWPNTIWFESCQQPGFKEFTQTIEKFYNSINVPVLGKYSDFMYDKSMFYDTNYHLNDRGMRHRTKQLIDLLQPYLSKMTKEGVGE